MMISILFTILLMIVSLGGLFLLGGNICLTRGEQIVASLIIQYDLNNASSRWAVKLDLRGMNMLNTIIFNGVQKTTQTTLIYTEFSTSRG